MTQACNRCGRPSPPYRLDAAGRCEARLVCARVTARTSVDPGLLKELRDDALSLPDDIRRTAAERLRLIWAGDTANRALCAWIEYRLNGVGYAAWQFIVAGLPDTDPEQIANLIDADGRWLGNWSGDDILRYVKAALRGEPSDDDCDLYRERERITRRASDRLTWAEEV